MSDSPTFKTSICSGRNSVLESLLDEAKRKDGKIASLERSQKEIQAHEQEGKKMELDDEEKEIEESQDSEYSEI
ncbi:MAG: hypothetical protein MHMPM18_000547 [Marteilia pararefringens]